MHCSDELKSEEPLRRLNSISRLTIIAQALGEERTRNELIPFLSENVDDEDEVLLAESEQLGNFVPYVGGPQYAHVLLPLLEQLSTVEETVVRDKAVESLAKVGSVMPDAATCDFFVPIVKVGAGICVSALAREFPIEMGLGLRGFREVRGQSFALCLGQFGLHLCYACHVVTPCMKHTSRVRVCSGGHSGLAILALICTMKRMKERSWCLPACSCWSYAMDWSRAVRLHNACSAWALASGSHRACRRVASSPLRTHVLRRCSSQNCGSCTASCATMRRPWSAVQLLRSWVTWPRWWSGTT